MLKDLGDVIYDILILYDMTCFDCKCVHIALSTWHRLSRLGVFCHCHWSFDWESNLLCSRLALWHLWWVFSRSTCSQKWSDKILKDSLPWINYFWAFADVDYWQDQDGQHVKNRGKYFEPQLLLPFIRRYNLKLCKRHAVVPSILFNAKISLREVRTMLAIMPHMS